MPEKYESPKPTKKTEPVFDTSKRLSVIVPYRDRADHLRQFSKHMLQYFTHDVEDRNIRFAVTVVEQADSQPFNAGLLKNIGARMTQDADYFCFHDVDYLPVWADYSFANNPARIVWHGAHERPYVPGGNIGAIHSWDTFWGGAVAVNKADLKKSNGYSNLYWGWGSEDDDFRNRLEVEGCVIEHRDGFFTALDHVSAGHDAKGVATEVGRKNHKIRERLLFEMIKNQWHKRDGLNSAKYEVQDVYKRKANLKPEDVPPNLVEWQHVRVRLPAAPKQTA